MHTTRSARYHRAKEARKAARLTPEQAAARRKVMRAIREKHREMSAMVYTKPCKQDRNRRRVRSIVWTDHEGYDTGKPVYRRPVAVCKAWRASV